MLSLKHIKTFNYSIALICCVFGNTDMFLLAQKSLSLPKRIEIDAKRQDLDPTTKEALPRSREFLRIDSTYYVGWLYEGIYKATHAGDFLGYKNAIAPLEKALHFIEKDFSKELSVRSSDYASLYPVYQRHVDYSYIAYQLYTCYSNIEAPELAYHLLQRALKWNFQMDYYLDPYNHLAWLAHRNRIFTNQKFSFLKSNISENEQLALRYLDSGIVRINKNKSLNTPLFGEKHSEDALQSVYHYKAILYSYALNYDSAKHYYDLLQKGGHLPYNNYASFQLVNGFFKSADENYQLASAQETGDKRLMEWAYYSSILSLYKAQPQDAENLMKQIIEVNGSTPGFGWYHIALGRAAYYNGSIIEAQQYLNKAANFKELHIGTTLGQEHYDFAIYLQRLAHQESLIAQVEFEHTDWWYRFSSLSKLVGLKAEKYMLQLMIINQFAQNPERDLVMYRLFSTESVVTWDEIWLLIKDFSPQFFIKRFKNELAINKRKNINKYFKLMLAKLYIGENQYNEASGLLQDIMNNEPVDPVYEKLFLARVFEAQAQIAEENKLQKSYELAMNHYYELYPQLIPFSGLKMKFGLNIQQSSIQDIIKPLKNYRIEFVSASSDWPLVHLTLLNENNIQYLSFKVTKGGKELIPKTKIAIKNNTQASQELAYKLFKVGEKSETVSLPTVANI